MGMPEWVMLDCGLLPTAFMGLCRRGAELQPQQRAELNSHLQRLEGVMSPERRHAEELIGVPHGPISDEEWVPVAEFCALPTLSPGEIMGYSLFSLEQGLGVRAKAIGLSLHAALGASAQLGVAQYSNLPALKSHLRFGPLELIDPLTPLHTKAGETFIYRLKLPPSEALLDMASGARLRYSPHDGAPHSAMKLQRGGGLEGGAVARSREGVHLQWIASDDLQVWAELRGLVLSGRERVELIDARLDEGRPSLCVRLTSLELEGERSDAHSGDRSAISSTPPPLHSEPSHDQHRQQPIKPEPPALRPRLLRWPRHLILRRSPQP
jgi:hypothetical protein